MDETLEQKLNGLPMPRPLGDPLMSLGRLFRWMVPAALVLVVIVIIVSFVDGSADITGLTLAGSLLLQTLTVVLTFSLGIPDRKVNALYLRNFRKDLESERIREHLEIALGPDFRLSGIRDPRKRINYFLRPFLLTVMIIKYAGARHLGLEAEADWKARIWASLDETRLVFIDLSVVTKYVGEEIRLCISTMPLQNIVFIVGDAVDEDEWRATFVADYGLSAQQKDQLQLAVWRSDADSNDEFMTRIGQFVSTAELAPKARLTESYELVSDSILSAKERRSEQIKKWVKILTGAILAFYALVLLEEELYWLPDILGWVVMLVIAVFVGYVLIQLAFGIRVKHQKLALARQFSPQDSRRYFTSLAKTYALLFLMVGVLGQAALNLYSDFEFSGGDEVDEIIIEGHW